MTFVLHVVSFLLFVRIATAVDQSLLCYCSDLHICPEESCVRKPKAACFHFVQEGYNNEDTAVMETRHVFGCLPPEGEKGGSQFQCQGHLSPHQVPASIACCYEGNYCNLNITPPAYNIPSTVQTPENGFSLSNLPLAIGCFGALVCLSVAVILLVAFCLRRCLFDPKRNKWLVGKKGKNLLLPDIESNGWLDEKTTLHELIEASSGSGSGLPQLVQRTIARQLDFGAQIGAGRYGEVYKAKWRGDTVAVKVFFTTEEASWAREREIYQTCMLRHENILGFIAADILGTCSTTKMLLVADYHRFGSLHDYLKTSAPLSILEAVQFAQSSGAGLAHLHEEIVGSKGKPAIAHRDVKSKNILVKAPGVALIADFGLAVKYCSSSGLDAGRPNTRVGTKRYMAPEVLDGSMNPHNFLSYKQADMYSFSLVLWEITRRIEDVIAMDDVVCDSPPSMSTESIGLKGDWANKSSSGNSSITALPYLCPFEDLVPSDPSFDQMKQIVCEDNQRPPIDMNWVRDGVHPALYKLAQFMTECWSAKAEARLPAVYVKKQLNKTLQTLLTTFP